MKPAISVQNLSKMYFIGQHQQGYATLRESIMSALMAPVRRWRKRSEPNSSLGMGRTQGDRFWALKDVNFEIQPGDVVGVIGRNGAGKSTLLKVLSNITEPTTGRIEIRGRVGSLLEVGTGFHQELTGRENIYMNGSILGMSRHEIQRKFDEIVEFAEIGEFLDTPVKRYSSGMYVRLAFSVAAHLEPEILFVDEVLAVGDLAFQKKCLGRMHTVASLGRSVLFVSHSMPAIKAICKTGIVMMGGKTLFQGDINDAINYYENDARELMSSASIGHHRRGTGEAKVVDIHLANEEGKRTLSARMGDRVKIIVKVETTRPIKTPQLGMAITTLSGQRLFRLNHKDVGVSLPEITNECQIECEIPEMLLLPGTYSISIGLHDGPDLTLDAVDDIISFDVLPHDVFGTGVIPRGRGDIIYQPSTWTIKNQPQS